MSEDTVSRLLALREHVHLVHHVPGRLRLRIGAGLLAGVDTSERERAADFLKDLPGIADVRVNPLAASVVVKYDAAAIAPSAWERLLVGERDEVLALVRELVPATLLDNTSHD